MNKIYQVIAISDHASDLYDCKALFIHEADAVTYKNLLELKLNSERNKYFYTKVTEMLNVELHVCEQNTTATFAKSIHDGLPFLLHDFEGIQEYLEEVVYEFIDNQLSVGDPKREAYACGSHSIEYPLSAIVWGSTPTA